MVAHGTPCMGPVTHAGRDAICPTYNRWYYACFGPKETPNIPSMSKVLKGKGMEPENVMRTFRSFNANTKSFLKGARDHEED